MSFSLPDRAGAAGVEVSHLHAARAVDEEALVRLVERVVAAEHARLAYLHVVLADHALVLALNRDFLEHDYLTDVLSFPLGEEPIPLLEDVVLPVEVRPPLIEPGLRPLDLLPAPTFLPLPLLPALDGCLPTLHLGRATDPLGILLGASPDPVRLVLGARSGAAQAHTLSEPTDGETGSGGEDRHHDEVVHGTAPEKGARRGTPPGALEDLLCQRRVTASRQTHCRRIGS